LGKHSGKGTGDHPPFGEAADHHAGDRQVSGSPFAVLFEKKIMMNQAHAEALPIFWESIPARGWPTTHLSGRPPTAMPTTAKCQDRRSRRCLNKIMRNRAHAEALPIFWESIPARGQATTHLSGRPPTTMPTTAKCRDRRSRHGLQKFTRNRANAEVLPIFWAGALARGRPTTHLSGRPPTTMPTTAKCRDRRSRRGLQNFRGTGPPRTRCRSIGWAFRQGDGQPPTFWGGCRPPCQRPSRVGSFVPSRGAASHEDRGTRGLHHWDPITQGFTFLATRLLNPCNG
jgi:hypothetical protein